MPSRKKNPRKRSRSETNELAASKRVVTRKSAGTGTKKKKTPRAPRQRSNAQESTTRVTRRTQGVPAASSSDASGEPPPKRPRRQPSQRNLTESDIPRIVEAVLKAKEQSGRSRHNEETSEDSSDSSHDEEEALEEVSGESRISGMQV